MTWILGWPSILDYSLGLSDTRVTMYDGSYRDCLLKIYNVHPGIVVGFAGNILIAFLLKDDLESWFSQNYRDLSPDPHVIDAWVSRARNIYNSCLPWFDAGGYERPIVELMIWTVHPTEWRAENEWHAPYVITIRSPDFRPIYQTKPVWTSIGSGAENYRAELAHLNETPTMVELVNIDNRNFNRRGLGTLLYVVDLLRKNPNIHVSQYLIGCKVESGAASLVRLSEDGTGAENNNDLPRGLVTTYSDLETVTGRSSKIKLATA